MTLQEAYKVMQANCGIEVGDTVKVLRKAEDREMEAYDLDYRCVRDQDSSVGGTFKVEKIFEQAIRVNRWNYPFFVLELVKKGKKLPEPVRISSQYKCKFKEDGSIAVGCQLLDFELIEKIYMMAKEVKEQK